MNVEPFLFVDLLKIFVAILCVGLFLVWLFDMKNAPEMDDEGNFIYPKDKLKDL